MSHFVYPAGTPTGTVPSNYVLPSTDWATTIEQVFKAINGDGGGTWAPSAFITVGGSGFEFTGTAHSVAASARLNVESTGEIRLKNGALLRADGTSGDIRLEVDTNVATLTAQTSTSVNLNGFVNLGGTVVWTTSGPGTATWQSGTSATFASGSTLTVASGGTAALAGTTTISGAATVSGTGSVQVASGATVTGVPGSSMSWLGQAGFADLILIAGSWVQFSTSRSWTRRGLTIALTTYNNGDTTGPSGPDSWVETSDISVSPVIRTASATATGQYTIIEFQDLPEAGEITSVEITTKGEGASIGTLPSYLLVRWQSGEANPSSLSLVTVDDHTTGNFTSITDTTTITPTATLTIDRAYRYGLKVLHPYTAGSGCYMRIYDVVVNGESDEVRV